MSNSFIKIGNHVINCSNITFILLHATHVHIHFAVGSGQCPLLILSGKEARILGRYLAHGNTTADLDNLFGGEV